MKTPHCLCAALMLCVNAFACAPSLPQYITIGRNLDIKVPRGTLSVAIDCYQEEFKRNDDSGPWTSTEKRGEPYSETYGDDIPGEAPVVLPGFQGERQAAWPAKQTTWKVDYEE